MSTRTYVLIAVAVCALLVPATRLEAQGCNAPPEVQKEVQERQCQMGALILAQKATEIARPKTDGPNPQQSPAGAGGPNPQQAAGNPGSANPQQSGGSPGNASPQQSAGSPGNASPQQTANNPAQAGSAKPTYSATGPVQAKSYNIEPRSQFRRANERDQWDIHDVAAHALAGNIPPNDPLRQQMPWQQLADVGGPSVSIGLGLEFADGKTSLGLDLGLEFGSGRGNGSAGGRNPGRSSRPSGSQSAGPARGSSSRGSSPSRSGGGGASPFAGLPMGPFAAMQLFMDQDGTSLSMQMGTMDPGFMDYLKDQLSKRFGSAGSGSQSGGGNRSLQQQRGDLLDEYARKGTTGQRKSRILEQLAKLRISVEFSFGRFAAPPKVAIDFAYTNNNLLQSITREKVPGTRAKPRPESLREYLERHGAMIRASLAIRSQLRPQDVSFRGYPNGVPIEPFDRVGLQFALQDQASSLRLDLAKYRRENGWRFGLGVETRLPFPASSGWSGTVGASIDSAGRFGLGMGIKKRW